jgi:hypothetical protein
VWGVFIERVSAVTNDKQWDAAVAASVEAATALALRAVRVPAIANDVPRFLSLLASMPGWYAPYILLYQCTKASGCHVFLYAYSILDW